jgi:hypothetical protein
MKTKTIKQLLKVPEYERLCELLSGDKNSKAGISPMEVQHLSWLAANIPQGGDIVEIGSHRGKSACAMGCGLRFVGNTTARLFCIDLWTLGVGKTYTHYSSEETWRIFNKSIEAFELGSLVHPRMMSSAKAATMRGKPIHLLFIDGNHKYQYVRQDWLLWSPFVPSGGRVVFHDYGTRFKGVDRVIDEEVIASGEWTDYQVHHRLWSATRK